MSAETRSLEQARREVEQSKRRFSSSMGALQYRLKPSTLANHAWEGVKDKGNAAADGAMVRVKERPDIASGIVAGLILYFARDSVWAIFKRVFTRRRDDPDAVTTRLDSADTNYDLTAPTMDRSRAEGAAA